MAKPPLVISSVRWRRGFELVCGSFRIDLGTLMGSLGVTARHGGVLCVASSLFIFSIRAEDAVASEIVLRVRGASAQSEVSFDLGSLAKLPAHTYSVTLPWDKTEHQYTGVLIRDILEAAHLPLTSIKATALNDYTVVIPDTDLKAYDPIVAYQVDGKTLSVRHKGPLLVVYPFKNRPELRSATTESRCIWQLTTISAESAGGP